MNRRDRSHWKDHAHRYVPSMEGLETRQLPSSYAPFSTSALFWPYSSSSAFSSNQQLASQAAVVRHEYDKYVGELKRLELNSQATTVEYLALRDDSRAISVAASAAGLPQAAARNTALEVSLQLDRSPLYGWGGDPGWSVVADRLTSNLDSLDVPQPLIDHTLADMRALAVSTGISLDGFQTFTTDFNTLRDYESALPPNPYYHFEDPSLYYTQHLRGFFRDWGVQRVAAEGKVHRDLRAIQVETRTDPAGIAVLHRDIELLKGLGAAVPSTTNRQLEDAYIAAFGQGVPTAQVQTQLRSSLVTILGPAAMASRIAANRLVADAPAFAQAVGVSASHVQTIVNDVGALVDAGGGEMLNPFKVTIQHAARPRPIG
jgi:hypothetical protein